MISKAIGIQGVIVIEDKTVNNVAKMAGLGGVIFATRLNSVGLNAGGGTILLDAIAAAVIGGTSLYGGPAAR